MKQTIIFFLNHTISIKFIELGFICAILLQGMLFLEKNDATSPETKGLSVDQ